MPLDVTDGVFHLDVVGERSPAVLTDKHSSEERPEEVLRHYSASNLPLYGQPATWPYIGRMKGA